MTSHGESEKVGATPEVREMRVRAWADALIKGYDKWTESEWLEACGRRHIQGLREAILDVFPTPITDRKGEGA